MGSYGVNFEFRVVPDGDDRGGRYATQLAADYATVIPQGAPVKVVGQDSLLRKTVALADTSTPPVPGMHGIAIYEHGDGATWAGDDPFLTTYSDKSVLPHGKAIQVISNPKIKVVFTNTTASTFLNVRSYAGRVMVPHLGATPSVSTGDYLEPHSSPSDANGYWQKTSTRANAWLVVSHVDASRDEVEAYFMF
jgi:hypothetical protein